jgi:hypothetical protein
MYYLYLFVLEPRRVADDGILKAEFNGTDLLEGCQSRSHLEAPLILHITLSREGWFRGKSKYRAALVITYISWLDHFGATTIKHSISADSKV